MKRKLSGKPWSEERRAQVSPLKGRKRPKEVGQKISLSTKGKKRSPLSEEHKRKISESGKGRIITEEELKKRSEYWTGRPKSEEHKKKTSVTLKGRKKSVEVVKRMIATLTGRPKSEEHKRKLSIKKKKDWLNPEYRKRHIEIVKAMWKNPDMVKRIIRSAQEGPNKPEKDLLKILDCLYPGEWKYVGKGEVVINGKVPDYININGQKKIIELFGDYWHKGEDPQERIDVFVPFGYDTLVIWEKELKNKRNLFQKLECFCKNK